MTFASLMASRITVSTSANTINASAIISPHLWGKINRLLQQAAEKSS